MWNNMNNCFRLIVGICVFSGETPRVVFGAAYSSRMTTVTVWMSFAQPVLFVLSFVDWNVFYCCVLTAQTLLDLTLMPCLEKICMVSFSDVNLYLTFFYPIPGLVLTTRRSLPLSVSRRTKRMLSQKERVGTEGLAWWRALYCKERNALIERAHRKETFV